MKTPMRRGGFLKSGRWLAGALMLSTGSAAAEPVSFARGIAPIFQRQCVGCHKAGKAKGKYRLDTYSHAMKELVAGNLEESELYYRITTDDEDDRMPVDANPLSKQEIELIRKWIEEGAKYDAEDPETLLSSIVPMEEHPAAPESYPRSLPVTAMVFSNDGQKLFTGGYHEILVWNSADGTLLRRIANNGQRTYDLALSPDGGFLAVASGAPGQLGEIRIFETSGGSVVAAPFRGDDVALAVAFDPKGERLAFGGADGMLRVVNTKEWKEELVVRAHSDWVNAIAWDSAGHRIATASRDKSAKVFDVAAGGKRLATFSGHSETVRGVGFHPNGNEVISCGDHGLVLRWKISNGKKSGDLAKVGGPALRMLCSESGYFVAGPKGQTVQLNLDDQKRERELVVAGERLPAIGEVVEHGSRLAVGTFDGRVVFFDLETGRRVREFVAAPGL